METLWFLIVALMLATYVILDGFDLGAGAIHLVVARTDAERQLILAAIGHVWDGNEVWLLAAGGTLYLAFPTLYASSFSGFYLPLMIVLWLLMLRGIGIEFRTHVESSLWRSFFDSIFALSSFLLTIFFGAALGNIIRGVPLNREGYFFEPLWTNFRVGPNAGILDWYTVLIGIMAFATLTEHGAGYIAAKTVGDLNKRARRAAALAGWVMALLAVLSLIATLKVRPQMLDNYRSSAVGAIFPAVFAVSLAAMAYFRAHDSDKAAFVSSSICIAALLGGAAFGLYPNLLPASTDPAYGLTVHNAAAGAYGLRVGITWWVIGIALVICYFVYLYRSFRGKVTLSTYH